MMSPISMMMMMSASSFRSISMANRASLTIPRPMTQAAGRRWGAYEFLGIPIQPIRGDITGDLAVGGADLIELLGAWGECASEDDGEDTCCAADLNADGVVDGGDLLILLGNWS